ncbi:two-component sensor histidine kinase [Aliishimia ponticola]|uniref:histidine kinase n=2 Tax=Aliishimia ponticola TaxID=2499833 RepID=A0A4S4NJV3_9RHOB|nr:two-component sensor histidine kinase [Aliishimia ponticola]
MHGVSDLLVACAYFAIPVLILQAVRRRPDLLDAQVGRLFATFILACGFSHLAGLATLWVPAYGLQAAIKVMTAIISVYTAIQLYRLLPRFLAMPSQFQMALRDAELLQSHRRAEESREIQEKMSEFAYIASHDLKAPMRGISNHAQFLVEDHAESLPADALKRITRMQELCARVEELISTLMQYSRLGRQQAIELFDTKREVEKIIETLRETLNEKNGTIEIDTPLPQISGNPAEFNTVMRNLITNGLTYNENDERTVHIGFLDSVEVNGKTMRNAFYVKDNGIGIDPEFQADVFKMFKRLNTNDKYSEGTGAGLAFVKKIVETSSGEIELQSALGAGSVFYFSLSAPPAAEGQSSA